MLLLVVSSFSCSDDDSPKVSSRAVFSSDEVADILSNEVVETTIAVDAGLNTVKNGSRVFFELNLSHTYVGDLIVEVIAPNGRTLPLLYDFGGSSELIEGEILVFNSTYTEVLMIDEETDEVLAGNYGPSLDVDFTPDWTMDTFFTDLSVAGTWTLKVTDEAGGDEGQIHGWTIRFEEDALNL